MSIMTKVGSKLPGPIGDGFKAKKHAKKASALEKRSRRQVVDAVQELRRAAASLDLSIEEAQGALNHSSRPLRGKQREAAIHTRAKTSRFDWLDANVTRVRLSPRYSNGDVVELIFQGDSAVAKAEARIARERARTLAAARRGLAGQIETMTLQLRVDRKHLRSLTKEFISGETSDAPLRLALASLNNARNPRR
jgi:hypothetical protein